MSYNKKTWLARLGQGLNKFSIDGATPVPIINQPDSVTQQGDALSAGNLNDLEQRIADAFDDVEESKADKSTTDALQSQINQQDARLNQHESRLENLEQKAGDYGTWHYPNDPDHSSDMPNKVPTGKAKNGLVEKIVGKTRAWNQLVKNGNFADTSNWALNGTGTFTVSDGVASVTCDSANRITQSLGSLVIGHKYLVSYKLKFSVADYSGFSVRLSDLNRDLYIDTWEETTSWQTVSQIVSNEYISAGAVIMFRDARTTKSEFKFTDVYIRDLTTIFPEGVPSTIAECVQKCPDLLKHNAYDAGSLVSTEVSAIKSVGRNLFVNSWDSASVTAKADGSATMSTKVNTLSEPFSVKPSTKYILKAIPSANSRVFIVEMDANDNVVASTSTSSWNEVGVLTQSNTVSMRLNWNPSVGQTAPVTVSQIQIEEGETATAFKPHFTDTLSLSETVTLRSAGNVADTDELNVEVLVDGVKVNRRRQTTRIESVDLGSLDWTKYQSRFYATISDAYYSSDNTTNLLCEKYIAQATDSQGYMWLYTGKIYIHDENYADADAFKTAMDGVMLNYELATPVVTLSDPITDNFIQVEGGGTINTIQEQTPVIDNCLDVGYLTV